MVVKIQFSNDIKTRVLLPKLDIPSDECGCGKLSIIFIHLAFWMGQQPSLPYESSQVLVPSGHWYFSSEEKTWLEVSMKPFVVSEFSTCCEGGIFLAAFKSIPALPSRQRLSVLLTSTAACTPNTDEYVRCTHWAVPEHFHPKGQQVLRLAQQTARLPHGQQLYPPPSFGQHFWIGHWRPSGHRFCNRD